MNTRCIAEKSKKRRLLLLLNNFIKSCYSILMYLCYPIAFLLKQLNVRVLNVRFEALGHLATEPDIYLREQMLLHQKPITILFSPYASLVKNRSFSPCVSNLFLLHCWKKHFIVIDHPLLYLALYPILKSPLLQHEPYYYYASKLSPSHKKGLTCTSIYRETDARNKGFVPFIKLTEQEQERGKEILQKLGMPKGAWYVCFSCREPGYYTQENLELVSCRNSSIERLELALREVVRRGGWCLRVGSPSTAPLPSSFTQCPQIIDYSHSPWVSDFMDIFLPANSRFSLGAMSGIIEVPKVFGIPCVVHNIIPLGLCLPSSKAINIFKLQKWKKTNQLIPFSQSLTHYTACSTTSEDYEELQIDLLENTQEEIRDAVVEMLDRLEGRLVYTPEEEALQNKFQSLMTSYNLSHQPLSRVGKEFLKKYRDLLR